VVAFCFPCGYGAGDRIPNRLNVLDSTKLEPPCGSGLVDPASSVVFEQRISIPLCSQGKYLGLLVGDRYGENGFVLNLADGYFAMCGPAPPSGVTRKDATVFLSAQSSEPHRTLCISLFKLSLHNFPEGHFVKRVLTIGEARERIARARAAGRLSGATGTDWVIDKVSARFASELLDALSDRDIALSLTDFENPATDGQHSGYFTPLAGVELAEDVDLLVISCNYKFNATPSAGLVGAINDVTFHLFSMGLRHGLSTDEAANVLNVSHPFINREIDSGRLPHRMVGTHRRIAFEDLLAFAFKMRERQAAALEKLAENARELGLDT
jgi:excisionase family DNA binding protein